MDSLATFQDAFAAALFADDALDPRVARLAAQPGFAIYRNTVLKGCVDALQANFPAVARLVGDEWFRAAAAVYARAELPTRPTLIDYGASFPQFIAAFPPAQPLPYLAGVALMDRLWSEAHTAADDALLRAQALASLGARELASVALRPHAAARWHWFDAQPIATIWHRNRNALDEIEAELNWRGEGALLTRPHGAVEFQPLERAGAAFLQACADGRPIADAAADALAVDPQMDFARTIERWLAAGVFAALCPVTSEGLA